MKILFVHDHRFYEQAGVYYSMKFSETIWKPYVMGDNIVTMFARKSKTPCPQVASCNKVKFKLSNNYSSPFSAVTNYRKIKKELEPYVDQSDRVIVRMPSILGVIASEIAIVKRKKIMAEVVGDAYDAYKYYGSFSGKVLAPVFRYLNKRAISRCDAAIYVTQDYLQDRYPTRGFRCACSDVLIEEVSPSVLSNRLERNNRPKRKLICGEIGNVSMPYKGYEIMLRAMRILRERGIRIEYHIVGGGNPIDVLKIAEKCGVGDSVFYDGMIDHSLIYEFYDSLDVYVHPSFTEGLPRVVVEAISRGCPCAVSDAGGTPELIDSEFIHRMGDANKLADDLMRFYRDKEIMNRVSVANFERAKAYYASTLESKRLDFYSKFYTL